MFQPPTDPLPTYQMSPDHLLPPLCDSPQLNPTPPIPNGGQFSSATHPGLKIAFPQRKNVLLSADLKEWNCTGTVQLLEAATSTTLWVYLDGSEKNHMTGAAAVFFPPDNDAFALAMPWPFDSLGDAEFWALLSCLRVLRTYTQYIAVFILSDN